MPTTLALHRLVIDSVKARVPDSQNMLLRGKLIAQVIILVIDSVKARVPDSQNIVARQTAALRCEDAAGAMQRFDGRQK